MFRFVVEEPGLYEVRDGRKRAVVTKIDLGKKPMAVSGYMEGENEDKTWRIDGGFFCNASDGESVFDLVKYVGSLPTFYDLDPPKAKIPFFEEEPIVKTPPISVVDVIQAEYEKKAADIFEQTPETLTAYVAHTIPASQKALPGKFKTIRGNKAVILGKNEEADTPYHWYGHVGPMPQFWNDQGIARGHAEDNLVEVWQDIVVFEWDVYVYDSGQIRWLLEGDSIQNIRQSATPHTSGRTDYVHRKVRYTKGKGFEDVTLDPDKSA